MGYGLEVDMIATALPDGATDVSLHLRSRPGDRDDLREQVILIPHMGLTTKGASAAQTAAIAPRECGEEA